MIILKKTFQLKFIILLVILLQGDIRAQQIIELDSDYCDWYFFVGKSKKQYMAIVPGSNINDLVCNQIIPSPYINNQIQLVKWVEDSIFTYVTTFNFELSAGNNYEILCEGLDTYAEVYLNNQIVLKGSNMFVAYRENITSLLRNGTNLLKIIFRSAAAIGKQKAIRSSIIYPADNEEAEVKVSPFLRKAAFQFGWDINPRLISCGIWQPIKIISTPKRNHFADEEMNSKNSTKPYYQLKQETDVEGQSFAFFENRKKPQQQFVFGANYVPYNMYPLPLKNYKRVAHIQQYQGLPNRYDYYRNLFNELKNYGCNMLRVWGGGWYEDDYFYDLADSMHIAIWQDFMFANTMYPCDEEWINNVKQEINYQVKRLKKHPCIVLWSGNNEIDVAWKNWGWQKKYKYSKQDSLRLIHDYQILFDQLIPTELNKQHIDVAYIPSSPLSNWGRTVDFKKGDNHYWGIWHGEAPLEHFNNHVPRFASEYGMPSLGLNKTLNNYNTNGEQQNKFIWNRMKSYKGMKLLNRYITDYLPPPISDSALSYASRYVQYKALKIAYNAHWYNYPFCSGSLFWQFNESWPGITWAAIDFSGQRKIPPYQSNYAMVVDEKGVVKYRSVLSKNDVNEINLIEFCIKDIAGNTIKKETMMHPKNELLKGIELNPYLYFDSLMVKDAYIKISFKNIKPNNQSIVWDTIVLLKKEKDYSLNKPKIKVVKIDEHHLKISSNELVIGLFIESNINPNLKFNQNFITIEAGQERVISLLNDETEIDLNGIVFYSLYDLQAEAKKE